VLFSRAKQMLAYVTSLTKVSLVSFLHFLLAEFMYKIHDMD